MTEYLPRPLIHRRLAGTLAADGHAAPAARATNVASSLQMGALDHINAVVSGVLDEVRDWSGTAVAKLTGSSASERQEGDEGKSESGELHSVDVCVLRKTMGSG